MKCLRNEKTRLYFDKLNPQKPKQLFWKACELLKKDSSSIPVLSTRTTITHPNVQFLNIFIIHEVNHLHYRASAITSKTTMHIYM